MSTSIKRKIAALKAKTAASGCTEAEALAAAEMAAKLMEQHGLSETEIEFVSQTVSAAKALPRWQRWLLNGISKVTNTSVISISGKARELDFAGKEHSVAIAIYLRDVLTRAVNAEIRRLRESPGYRRLRKQSSKTAMVNSFAAGMISRITVKLQSLFASTISAHDRAVARQMLERKYVDACETKSRPFSVGNDRAYMAGVRAGNAVEVSHGVAGAAAASLSLVASVA
jgi:Protein of unknown function (DUF2786)